jgi:hypothetical protein
LHVRASSHEGRLEVKDPAVAQAFVEGQTDARSVMLFAWCARRQCSSVVHMPTHDGLSWTMLQVHPKIVQLRASAACGGQPAATSPSAVGCSSRRLFGWLHAGLATRRQIQRH